MNFGYISPSATFPSLECKDPGLDIGIILDSSGSVGQYHYEITKNFTVDLVDKMHVSKGATHVGVIHYSSYAYLNWNFNSDVARNIDDLKKGIKQLPFYSGGTRTDRALEKAWDDMFKPGNGARPQAPHVLLVFTDGKTNKGSKKYEDVLKPLVVIK